MKTSMRILVAVVFSAALHGCSNKYEHSKILECKGNSKLYKVQMSDVGLETYLFINKDENFSYSYVPRWDGDEYRTLDRIYRSKPGRDIGVEAYICGEIRPLDSSLAYSDKSMMVDQIRIIRTIDMTSMIQNHLEANGLVVPPLVKQTQ